MFIMHIGCPWFPHEHCQPSVYQGHIPDYPYGFFSRTWSSFLCFSNVAISRYHHKVCRYLFYVYFNVLSVSLSFFRGRASSIAIILLGSIYYTWIKHEESQAPPTSLNASYERVQMEDVESGHRKEAKPE